jgi:hypothetical protein
MLGVQVEKKQKELKRGEIENPYRPYNRIS